MRKSGTITVHYRSTAPFLIQNKDGSLKGLEYEMMVGFRYYLKNKYNLDLTIEWKNESSFNELLDVVSTNTNSGELGLGNVSKTKDREKIFEFSNSYFPDIQIMVSGHAIPTASTLAEFKENFDDYTAISVQGTTYNQNLLKIKSSHNLNFEITYVNTSNDILPTILKTVGSFGYTDLPNYIMAINNNDEIKRQPILPIRGEGYCIIFKKNSSWAIPINEYLASSEYQLLRDKGIHKYLGADVFNLMASISRGENEEIILLLKEKELVDIALKKKARQVERQSYITNMLLACVLIILIALYALFNRNRIKSKANEILTIHRSQIESQNTLLTKRNDELIELDEEKNNFINILSHDLRAPINNINGLAGILKLDDKLQGSPLKMIEHISAESRRLNKMVTRILDIERIEKKTVSDFRSIHLKEVLDKVVSNYLLQAGDKKIEIKLICETGLYVKGLEQFLFHVFENLLSNAIKFSPLGSLITVNVTSDEENHSIDFVDQGPGLRKDDKENMYKKFTRLSAKPTAGERSTGLGLSIVYKYAQLLGGKLSCKSEGGNGSTFTVRLKAVEPLDEVSS